MDYSARCNRRRRCSLLNQDRGHQRLSQFTRLQSALLLTLSLSSFRAQPSLPLPLIWIKANRVIVRIHLPRLPLIRPSWLGTLGFTLLARSCKPRGSRTSQSWDSLQLASVTDSQPTPTPFSFTVSQQQVFSVLIRVGRKLQSMN